MPLAVLTPLALAVLMALAALMPLALASLLAAAVLTALGSLWVDLAFQAVLDSQADLASQVDLIGSGNSGYSVVSGGPLAVTAISPIGPSGLAVASENAIEGNLLVTGQLPFLSAVAFEGALPTAGSGVATCGCGSGQVGIVSEGFGRPSIYY
ncbi:chorion class CB protein M5H4-like [Ostrinia furnacalis]|uniref:chorion class CB protein M5H4-like n=1 Tax=Ostrinia furnacalis TaxID=93504 RepID=UPI00103FCA26|nr:chorion class CB protein M5H4-like [Ostrinia furnacalis]